MLPRPMAEPTAANMNPVLLAHWLRSPRCCSISGLLSTKLQLKTRGTATTTARRTGCPRAAKDDTHCRNQDKFCTTHAWKPRWRTPKGRYTSERTPVLLGRLRDLGSLGCHGLCRRGLCRRGLDGLLVTSPERSPASLGLHLLLWGRLDAFEQTAAGLLRDLLVYAAASGAVSKYRVSGPGAARRVRVAPVEAGRGGGGTVAPDSAGETVTYPVLYNRYREHADNEGESRTYQAALEYGAPLVDRQPGGPALSVPEAVHEAFAYPLSRGSVHSALRFPGPEALRRGPDIPGAAWTRLFALCR